MLLDNMVKVITNKGDSKPPEKESVERLEPLDTLLDSGYLYKQGRALDPEWIRGRLSALNQIIEGHSCLVVLSGEHMKTKEQVRYGQTVFEAFDEGDIKDYAVKKSAEMGMSLRGIEVYKVDLEHVTDLSLEHYVSNLG